MTAGFGGFKYLSESGEERVEWVPRKACDTLGLSAFSLKMVEVCTCMKANVFSLELVVLVIMHVRLKNHRRAL